MKTNRWPREFLIESLKRHRNICLGLLVVAIFSLTPASVDAAPKFSPSGPQKVLVVLVDLGSTIADLCPILPVFPCPQGLVDDLPNYKPPRHTAQEWEQLLNQYGSQFWELASYNQLQPQFTVLANPSRSDGWWGPPHSAREYFYNGSLFVDHFNGPFFWAEAIDPPRYAIETFCSSFVNQSFCLSELPQYNRLIVMSNKKLRGGVSCCGPYSPLSLTVSLTPLIYTPVQLPFTITLANEDSNDMDAISVMMHEFGHQLGTPTHYGNCAPDNNIPVSSTYMDPTFNNPPPGFLECMGFWDVMGFDQRWSLPGGFSRWNRGWIDSNTTLSVQLQTAQPFSQLSLIRPVEAPPANGVANLIRLSRGLLSDPFFYGYFIECRVKANGDEGLYQNSGGIPQEGLLITNVHEGSKPTGSKSLTWAHIARPQFPAGGINSAVLSPGGTFTDPNWQLIIRFNSWVGDGPDRLCDVEIDYQRPLLTGPIVMWQNRVTPSPEPSLGFSSDIGINHPQQAPSATGDTSNTPLIVDPLWPNHNNVLFARAHTLGTLPVQNVALKVGITQPAVITSGCGTHTDISTDRILLPPVDPLQGAVGSLNFVPRQGSLGVQVVPPADPAGIQAEANSAISRVTFEFFHAGNRKPETTHFILKANPGCDDQTSFTLFPGDIPDGWSASISPNAVSLAPGETADIAVSLTPPASALQGENVVIPINVHETMPSPSLPLDPALPVDSRLAVHENLIGSMQILARVVGDDAEVDLMCPHSPSKKKKLSVSGRIAPSIANSTVMLEYKSRHTTKMRFATTNANGVFQDSFPPGTRGPLHVQAFWPGDAMHAPAQSSPCVVQTGHPIGDKGDKNDRAHEK